MNFYLNLFKFYDLGGPTDKSEIIEKVNNMEFKSCQLKKYQVDSERREPDYVNYPEPITFNLTKKINSQNKEIEIICKIFRYGALSLHTEIDSGIESMKELSIYYEKKEIAQKIENYFDRIYNEFYEMFAEDLKKEYRSKKCFTNLYPVYCISDTDYNDVEKLVENKREEIGQLLTGMYGKKDLSEEQIDNVLKHNNRFRLASHWATVPNTNNRSNNFKFRSGS